MRKNRPTVENVSIDRLIEVLKNAKEKGEFVNVAVDVSKQQVFIYPIKEELPPEPLDINQTISI